MRPIPGAPKSAPIPPFPTVHSAPDPESGDRILDRYGIDWLVKITANGEIVSESRLNEFGKTLDAKVHASEAETEVDTRKLLEYRLCQALLLFYWRLHYDLSHDESAAFSEAFNAFAESIGIKRTFAHELCKLAPHCAKIIAMCRAEADAAHANDADYRWPSWQKVARQLQCKDRPSRKKAAATARRRPTATRHESREKQLLDIIKELKEARKAFEQSTRAELEAAQRQIAAEQAKNADLVRRNADLMAENADLMRQLMDARQVMRELDTHEMRPGSSSDTEESRGEPP